MSFDIRSLVQFVAVADELSFTRAAERLGIAQPWLSKRIRLLEEQLGFALFVRTTRRTELTEKGEAFLAVARPVAEALRQADSVARSLARAERQTLRIGVPPYGARLPIRNAILARFGRENSGVSLELEVGWTPRLLERVLEGDLDGAFGMGWQDATTFRTLNLSTLITQLRLGREDPLWGRNTVSMGELKDRRIAVFTRGLYPALYDRAFAEIERAGARLIQMPEIHARLIEEDAGTPPLMVLEFGVDQAGDDPWRVTVEGAPLTPFSFFAPAGPASPALERFIDTAKALSTVG